MWGFRQVIPQGPLFKGLLGDMLNQNEGGGGHKIEDLTQENGYKKSQNKAAQEG